MSYTKVCVNITFAALPRSGARTRSPLIALMEITLKVVGRDLVESNETLKLTAAIMLSQKPDQLLFTHYKKVQAGWPIFILPPPSRITIPCEPERSMNLCNVGIDLKDKAMNCKARLSMSSW